MENITIIEGGQGLPKIEMKDVRVSFQGPKFGGLALRIDVDTEAAENVTVEAKQLITLPGRAPIETSMFPVNIRTAEVDQMPEGPAKEKQLAKLAAYTDFMAVVVPAAAAYNTAVNTALTDFLTTCFNIDSPEV